MRIRTDDGVGRQDVAVRLAVPGDAASVARVLSEAFLEYRDLYTPQAFAATAITSQEVQKRLGEGPVWLAIDGSPIGTVSAINRREHLYVRGMAVVPSARGLAVGRRLLWQVEAFAAKHNCPRLVLCTTPFLVRAIQLYEHWGFVRDEGVSDLHGTPLFTMTKTMRLQAGG